MAFRLKWPTQFPHIIQKFGENKTGDPNFYKQFGLPAHEGLDFVAPTGSEIYACADGVIKLISDGRDGAAYGVQVRIIHNVPEGEFETVYAHLQSPRHGLTAGMHVKRGDLIGLANSTGHSLGAHLHLTLKKKGATARGETNYPKDIMNPEPFLDAFDGKEAKAREFDNLSFLADITIPDDTVLAMGAPFNKLWRVKNSGTTTWKEGYELRFKDHTQMSDVTRVSLPPCAPGEETTITISMTAPKQTGKFKSTWQANNKDGEAFGTPIFVLIRVVKPT